MADFKFEIGAQLPGEQIAARILDIALEMVRKMPPDVAEKYWNFALEDYNRWRTFWDKILPH